MRALLVRHASAGNRRAWSVDDRLRPLDGTGRQQAKALAATLATLGADRLLSSPCQRCLETLEPTAQRLGLPIESREEIAEGASVAEVRSLLAELDGSLPALSTHGDVVEALLPGRKCKKGGIWVVDVFGGDVRPERYLPPA